MPSNTIKGLFPGVGKILRLAKNDLPLGSQTATHCLWQVIHRKSLIDQPHCTVQIAAELPPENIFRQSYMQIAKIFINIRGNPLLSVI